MLILLPKDKAGLRALEASLTPERLEAWSRRLVRREVELYLPRFKLALSVGLRPILQELGIHSAFGRAADFSAVTSTKKINVGAAGRGRRRICFAEALSRGIDLDDAIELCGHAAPRAR